jgi:hypothetical protein
VINITQPECACDTCWRSWLNSRPRPDIGYCWHGQIAWRIRPSGEFIAAAGVTREKHRALVRELHRSDPFRGA